MSTGNLQQNWKTFGERICALRKERGWTLNEVAMRVDAKRASTVGNWENPPPGREIIPDKETLLKLAATFEVTVSYLLYGEIGEPEGDNKLQEVARWKDRAIKAEQKLAQIEKTAAGLLAEIAEGVVDRERKESSSAKIPMTDDEIVEAFEKLDDDSPSSKKRRGGRVGRPK